MAVLSVQSHVAYGHVGNRSAVFPLERLGFEVWPINTVQFSNHTGYGSWRGEVFAREHIRSVWRGVSERGVSGECEAVLSGYLGDVGIGYAIMESLAEIRSGNPHAIYCCDPVMGDVATGLYVREGIPEFLRKVALPEADIVTPNMFEAGILSGMRIESLADARAACRAIHDQGPRIVLVTSFRPLREDDRTAANGTVAMLLSDDGRLFRIRTPELPFAICPNGAGDLSSALFLGHYLKTGSAETAFELMTDGVFSVFEATWERGARELAIVQSQEEFSCGRRRFGAVRCD